MKSLGNIILKHKNKWIYPIHMVNNIAVIVIQWDHITVWRMKETHNSISVISANQMRCFEKWGKS